MFFSIRKRQFGDLTFRPFLEGRFRIVCPVPRSRIRENSDNATSEFSRIRLRELGTDLRYCHLDGSIFCSELSSHEMWPSQNFRLHRQEHAFEHSFHVGGRCYFSMVIGMIRTAHLRRQVVIE